MAVDHRRVAIVDDAINAGSAVAATAAALPQVVAVGALLTLGAAPATLAGAPVERLATLDSALWPAADLPAVRRRLPTRRPTLLSPLHCPRRYARARAERRLSSVGRAIHS